MYKKALGEYEHFPKCFFCIRNYLMNIFLRDEGGVLFEKVIELYPIIL